LDDPTAREKARVNTGRESDLKRPIPKRRHKDDDSQPALAGGPEAVLIAEIPRAGDRWGQANLDKENFEGFFGASAAVQRRILLQHVRPDGTASPIESRPSVARKSKNYSFELGAAAGLYPPGPARPIAVYVKTTAGVFLYQLLMPGDPAHEAVSAFLSARWTGRTDRMRRVLTTVDDLQAAWPDSPLWSPRPGSTDAAP
jgi:hypothetical protein